jgi:putative glycosyltransferase (TIGR04348 family)
MKITLVTPASKGSQSGNRVTAVRWGTILRRLGHRVRIVTEYGGEATELMVVIHAWRSAEAAAQFKAQQPDCPLVVLLSGTDIYRFQYEAPGPTLATMRAADRLVGLHDRVHLDIPEQFGSKLHIIYQSCLAPRQPRKPTGRSFKVCVVGHLRDEKDPLRAAYAARLMPRDSRLQIVHLGAAHSPDWADAARAEARDNPRYEWRGPLPAWQVRGFYARCHAMVISSVMEGGANVVTEAIVAGLPVIASDISGNRGLLGEAHAAYFPAGDEQALAALLSKAQGDRDYLESLATAAAIRQPKLTRDAELAAWSELIEALRR